jgi:hypothetical protein
MQYIIHRNNQLNKWVWAVVKVLEDEDLDWAEWLDSFSSRSEAEKFCLCNHIEIDGVVEDRE